jgi:hypothetical protein
LDTNAPLPHLLDPGFSAWIHIFPATSPLGNVGKATALLGVHARMTPDLPTEATAVDVANFLGHENAGVVLAAATLYHFVHSLDPLFA